MLLVGIHVQRVARIVELRVFEAQAGNQLQAAAQLLVVAQVGRMDRLTALVVLGLLHRIAHKIELRGIPEVEARKVLLADKIADRVVPGIEIPARGIESVAGAHRRGDEGLLVCRLHVVEGDEFRFFLVLVLVSGLERTGKSTGEEPGAQVDMGLVLVLLDLAERLGQFVELDEVRRVELHARCVGGGEVRFAAVRKVNLETDRIILVALQSDVALVGTVLRSPGVVEAPLDTQPAEVVLARQGDVGGLLTLQTRKLVVGRSALGLTPQVGRGRAVPVGRDILIGQPVTVLPVVAPVVHAAQLDLVVLVELPVERERIALPLAVHVVLTNLELVDVGLPVVILFPCRLDSHSQGKS